MAKPAQQAKASAGEKVRGTDRDWLSAKEAATAIGWRVHTLKDAFRGRHVDGVEMTSHGYRIQASAITAIGELLGPAPARHIKKAAAPSVAGKIVTRAAV